MTPVRKCVQDIIDMADTGMSLEEIEAMQGRVDRYIAEVPSGHQETALDTLRETLEKASRELTMSVSASDLLDHAISYVEGKRRRS